MLTRMVTLAAIIVLAVPVLSNASPDFRVATSLVVSAGAVVLALRAFLLNRFLWGLAFLGVLGAFTPFRPAVFSPALVWVIDLAALALFAGSPLILKKSKTPVISGSSAPRS